MIIRLAYSMSRKVQKLTTAENASDSSQSENSLVGTNSYSKMLFKNKHRCLTFKTKVYVHANGNAVIIFR